MIHSISHKSYHKTQQPSDLVITNPRTEFRVDLSTGRFPGRQSNTGFIDRVKKTKQRKITIFIVVNYYRHSSAN